MSANWSGATTMTGLESDRAVLLSRIKLLENELKATRAELEIVEAGLQLQVSRERLRSDPEAFLAAHPAGPVTFKVKTSTRRPPIRRPRIVDLVGQRPDHNWTAVEIGEALGLDHLDSLRSLLCKMAKEGLL